jgi:hypothetical protein
VHICLVGAVHAVRTHVPTWRGQFTVVFIRPPPAGTTLRPHQHKLPDGWLMRAACKPPRPLWLAGSTRCGWTSPQNSQWHHSHHGQGTATQQLYALHQCWTPPLCVVTCRPGMLIPLHTRSCYCYSLTSVFVNAQKSGARCCYCLFQLLYNTMRRIMVGRCSARSALLLILAAQVCVHVGLLDVLQRVLRLYLWLTKAVMCLQNTCVSSMYHSCLHVYNSLFAVHTMAKQCANT